MRSLIVFTFLFFTLHHTAAAERTKRQDDNGAAGVPAFSYESNKFQLRIDKETLEFVNGKLGERPPKFRNKRHDIELVDRQAPDVIDRERVAAFTDLFRRAVREGALVCFATPGLLILIVISIGRWNVWLKKLQPSLTPSILAGTNWKIYHELRMLTYKKHSEKYSLRA